MKFLQHFYISYKAGAPEILGRQKTDILNQMSVIISYSFIQFLCISFLNHIHTRASAPVYSDPAFFLLENPAYCYNCTIVCRRCIFNACCRITCVDNCISSDIDSDMSVIAYDIARLHAVIADAIADTAECTG